MADERIWTAEDLARLSPEERDRVVRAGIVTDLSTLPPEFVERIRATGRRLLTDRGVTLPEAE